MEAYCWPQSNNIESKQTHVSASDSSIAQIDQQVDTMRSYYKLHAKIYDLSRWTFLFGRKAVIKQCHAIQPTASHILEVGCGTGVNILSLKRYYPKAIITGLDVSSNMLQKAKKRTNKYADHIKLVEAAYGSAEGQLNEKQDLILFSYSLSMINPQWEELLVQAEKDLKPGGIIGVVDFYDSKYSWFKKHMGNNHVRMDSHLSPILKKLFNTEYEKTPKAYGGVWQYFMHIGRKR